MKCTCFKIIVSYDEEMKVTMNSDYFISIIVPVYNTGSYLKRCIISLKKQINAQFEIILVDDGSTDGSAEICDELAEQNDNIIAVHQKNAGPGIARNTGITIAKGNYIVFCDSDDYWNSETTSFLHDVIKNIRIDSNIDVFVFNGKSTYTDESDAVELKDFKFLWELQPVFSSGWDYLEHALDLKYDYKWFPVLYVFNKKLFLENAISFPDNRLGEDTATLYKLLLVAKKTYIMNKAVYIYTKERRDSCSKAESFDLVKGTVDIAESCIEDVRFRDIPEKLKKLLCNNFSVAFFTALIHVKSIEKENQKKMIEYLKTKKHIMNYAITPKQVLTRKLIRILGYDLTARLLNLRRKVRKG